MATSAFDPRLMLLTVQLQSGNYTFDQEFSIRASGTKLANALPGQLEVRIYNLTREMQNNILTQASPMQYRDQPRKAINVALEVGRQPTGLFRLFEGFAFQCGMTQPPDIGITLRAITNNLAAQIIAGLQAPKLSTLQAIAQNVANSNGLTLDFQSKQGAKQINNWSVSGSLQQQLYNLQLAAEVDVIVDGSVMIVLDHDATRHNSNILVSADTGMVGIPQVTEFGVVATVMINPAFKIGGGVTIDSKLNPAANGTYKIYQMDFDVASRDTPFWYRFACSRHPIFQGTN